MCLTLEFKSLKDGDHSSCGNGCHTFISRNCLRNSSSLSRLSRSDFTLAFPGMCSAHTHICFERQKMVSFHIKNIATSSGTACLFIQDTVLVLSDRISKVLPWKL